MARETNTHDGGGEVKGRILLAHSIDQVARTEKALPLAPAGSIDEECAQAALAKLAGKLK